MPPHTPPETVVREQPLPVLIEQLVAMLDRFAARPDNYTPPAHFPGPDNRGATNLAVLQRLATTLTLSPFAQGVLLLCAAAEIDPRIAARCASCNTDGNTPWPTFGLAMRLLPAGTWKDLLPVAPLRRYRLVTLAPGAPLMRAALRIDERVLHMFTGFDFLDERLRGFARVVWPPQQQIPSQTVIAEQIAATWKTMMAEASSPMVNVYGNDRTAKLEIAATVSDILGMNLLSVSVDVVPSQTQELRELAELLDRECILGNAALFFDADDIDGRPDISTSLSRLVDYSTAPTFVSTPRRRPPGARPSLGFVVNKPPRAIQRALWVEQLGPSMSTTAGRLSAAFDLGADTIRIAAKSAKTRSVSDPDKLGSYVWETCQAEARAALEDLAQRIEPFAGWDDLVLPDKQKETLQHVSAQLRNRALVYDEWGLGSSSNRGLAIAALFAGPSGTGKTMAAEVLAKDLSLDLFHVDLSAVVSKYIGETERNLARIFDRAEGAGAILLFDEADSIFGKRTEVKDSHDRNANMEVSYLLQRLESYRGLAILTSNLPDSLDTAFLRRIRFVVQFPFPDAPARKRIWQRVFPEQAPLEGVQFDKLAQLNVAGGQIRNIAVNAAFIAASLGQPIRMDHLFVAAKSELEKVQRAPTTQETKGWI